MQFLEGLFATLRRAGVLQSQRGVKGGYSFARPPAEITVLEVVELLRASSAPTATSTGMERGLEAVRDVLAASTIAEGRARGAGGGLADVLHLRRGEQRRA